MTGSVGPLSSNDYAISSLHEFIIRKFLTKYIVRRFGGNTFRLSGPVLIKLFFMLNSAEQEISKLDKSNLINLLEKTFDLWRFPLFLTIKSKF